MIVTSKLTMDLQNPAPAGRIHAVQNDRYCRNLEITLLAGGESWPVPEDAAVVIRYSKADGTDGEYDVLPDGTAAWTAEENVLTVALAPQVLTAAGPVSLMLSVILEEKQISSFRVLLQVDPAVGLEIGESVDYFHVTRFLPAPAAAAAGEYLRIASVDGDGKITQVETVDISGLLEDTADPPGAAASAVAGHNGDPQAHPDLRQEVLALAQKECVTKTVSDLVNYYTRSETYTQAQVNAMISAIPKFKIQVVSSLPTADISETTVYLLKTGEDSQNLYTEYIHVAAGWEKLGEQTVDLSGYAKQDWVSSLVASCQPKGDYALRSELPAVPVQSVNGKTGAVQLTAADVGARASDWMPGAADVGAVPVTRTLTVTGIDADGVSHSWTVYGVAQ